jgi:hypothetical protein
MINVLSRRRIPYSGTDPFEEILQRQGGILGDIARFFKECTGNDDFPNPPPIPDWVFKDANRRIPIPVYPGPGILTRIPGSDAFWGGVATGAATVSVGAGIIATGGAIAPLIGAGGATSTLTAAGAFAL